MEKSAQERNKAEEGVGECRGGVSPEQMVRGVIKVTFVGRLRGGEGAGLQMSEVARAALTGWLLSRVLGLTPPEGRVIPPTYRLASLAPAPRFEARREASSSSPITFPTKPRVPGADGKHRL